MPHTSARRPVRGSPVRRDRHHRTDARDPADADAEAPLVEVQRLGGADRRTVGLVGLVAAALVLVVAKPWGGAPSAGSPTAPAVAPRAVISSAAPASPLPRATTDPGGEQIPCWSSEEWRAVTVERRERQTIISWMAVDPVAADGPDDDGIPLLRVVSDDVLAIGFCEPIGSDVPLETLPTAISVWRRADGAAYRVTSLRAAAPLATDAAAVFRPGSGRWRPGQYAVQVLATAARARDGRPLRGRWFGFEIVPLPRDATRTPRPSATPPPPPGSQRVTCRQTSEWSLVTLELDGDVERQVAYPAGAVPGPADPDDPRLVPQPLAAAPLAAIGFCPPTVDERGAALTVTGARFWRRQEYGVPLRLNVGDRLGSASGERDPWLYGPPSIVGSFGFVPWPPGTYVVAVDAIDTDSYWFALTLGPPG